MVIVKLTQISVQEGRGVLKLRYLWLFLDLSWRQAAIGQGSLRDGG